MVEAKIYLYTHKEMELFTEFTMYLERERDYVGVLANVTQKESDRGWQCYDAEKMNQQPSAAEQEAIAIATVPSEQLEIVGITFDEVGEEVLVPADATEAEAGEALRVFLKSNTAAPAVAILREFGVNRVGELAPEKRGEFVARLQSTGSTTETLK